MVDVNKTRFTKDSRDDEAYQALSKKQLSNVYVGQVVDSKDYTRAGRVRVFIEALDGEKDKTTSHFNVQFTSPFAGATEMDGTGTDISSSSQTRTSYGMWMMPPDVGNLVLVAFANGNPKRGFILSCLYPDRMQHMVPGNPSGLNYTDPSIMMPVKEKNARDEKQTHNDAVRPVHTSIAKGIVLQGLINDPLRGAGTSGARREAPSQVFGFLTPGPRDPENDKLRLGGHSFVMDDHPTNSLIRLRSKGGNQILMDDTTGSIYMINNRGNAWFELASNGDINLFSEGSINMRSEGNLNLRADKNINIEAGQNVHVKAAGDRKADGDYAGIPALGALGLPPMGVGGNIRFEAAGEWSALGQRGAQLTAVGGDIDFSAAGRIANSGAKFDVFTAGVAAPWGSGISLMANTGAFMASGLLGSTIVSPAITAIVGATVQLNSAPAMLPIPAVVATVAPQIGTNKFKDAAVKPPEWKDPKNKPAKQPTEDSQEENDTPEAMAPTAGERTGKVDQIDSIVTAMLTKEPYMAHYNADPIAESNKKASADPTITEKLPEGASTSDQKQPDTVQTPEGSNVGTSYKDKDGNVITGVNDALDATTAAGKEALSGAQAVMDAAKDPIGTALSALEGTPVYDKMSGIFNNFTTMNETKLLEIMGLGGLIAGIKAALPPIRFPTSNALMEKIIGLKKELSALQAQLNQFGLDKLGFDLELLKGKMGEMQGLINDAVAMAKDAQDLKNILESHGISMPVDGEMIFEDAFGNKLVDFSGGIGPVGATLGLVADLNNTYNTISGDLKVPLHDHGKLAITSFANSISPEVFAGSRVATMLNDTDQHKNVAREMQKWVLDKPGGTIDPVLVAQRLYESQLFQSPDEMDINLGDLPEGGVPWSVLADMLKAKREEFYVKKTSEDGPA
jgi:hypothetical protein